MTDNIGNRGELTTSAGRDGHCTSVLLHDLRERGVSRSAAWRGSAPVVRWGRPVRARSSLTLPDAAVRSAGDLTEVGGRSLKVQLGGPLRVAMGTDGDDLNDILQHLTVVHLPHRHPSSLGSNLKPWAHRIRTSRSRSAGQRCRYIYYETSHITGSSALDMARATRSRGRTGPNSRISS